MTTSAIQDIKSQKSERSRSNCRAKHGISDVPNPFLDLPLDLHKYAFFIVTLLVLCGFILCRSTPVELLHTLLLGPYKYLLRCLMKRLSAKEKEEIRSIVSSFNFSGFKVKLSPKISKYFRSFVGRDFKALAQCALFIFRHHFTENERSVWLAL